MDILAYLFPEYTTVAARAARAAARAARTFSATGAAATNAATAAAAADADNEFYIDPYGWLDAAAATGAGGVTAAAAAGGAANEYPSLVTLKTVDMVTLEKITGYREKL